jgi:hypothetical protein
MLPRRSVSPAPPGTVVRGLSDLVIALPVGLVRRPDAAPPPPALAALTDALRRELRRHASRPGIGVRSLRDPDNPGRFESVS